MLPSGTNQLRRCKPAEFGLKIRKRNSPAPDQRSVRGRQAARSAAVRVGLDDLHLLGDDDTLDRVVDDQSPPGVGRGQKVLARLVRDPDWVAVVRAGESAALEAKLLFDLHDLDLAVCLDLVVNVRAIDNLARGALFAPVTELDFERSSVHENLVDGDPRPGLAVAAGGEEHAQHGSDGGEHEGVEAHGILRVRGGRLSRDGVPAGGSQSDRQNYSKTPILSRFFSSTRGVSH